MTGKICRFITMVSFRESSHFWNQLSIFTMSKYPDWRSIFINLIYLKEAIFLTYSLTSILVSCTNQQCFQLLSRVPCSLRWWFEGASRYGMYDDPMYYLIIKGGRRGQKIAIFDFIQYEKESERGGEVGQKTPNYDYVLGGIQQLRGQEEGRGGQPKVHAYPPRGGGVHVDQNFKKIIQIS